MKTLDVSYHLVHCRDAVDYLDDAMKAAQMPEIAWGRAVSCLTLGACSLVTSCAMPDRRDDETGLPALGMEIAMGRRLNPKCAVSIANKMLTLADRCRAEGRNKRLTPALFRDALTDLKANVNMEINNWKKVGRRAR